MTYRVSLDYELLLEQEPQLPEKKLFVAVIHKAILDFYGQESTLYQQQQAGRWIFSNSHEKTSLYWYCSWLVEDPQWLLQAIQEAVRQRKTLKGPMVRVDTK